MPSGRSPTSLSDAAGSDPSTGAGSPAGRAEGTRTQGRSTGSRRSQPVERPTAGTGRLVVGLVRRQLSHRRGQQLLQPIEIGREHRQHLGMGDRLSALDPRIEVGDQGDAGEAQSQLASDRRLGLAGHPDHRPALGGVPGRLGPAGEAGAVDHHESAAVDRLAAQHTATGSDHGPTTARAVGIGERDVHHRADIVVTVCARPQVRSTTWSGTTMVPGPRSGLSEPTADGASTCRTPTERSAHRLAR